MTIATLKDAADNLGLSLDDMVHHQARLEVKIITQDFEIVPLTRQMRKIWFFKESLAR